jgi:L-threonylcarbamoyladenylate synthase
MNPDTSLAAAIAALRGGGIVLHPTEAVWGLAAAAHDPGAVAAVYALKQRPAGKGLIVVGSDLSQLAPLLAPVPEDRMRAALATWPGPHTWVFPAADSCPPWLRGERGSLAVRVSAHPLTRALCEGFAAPIVSTSANRSGDPPPRTLAEVDEAVRSGVAATLEGPTSGLDRPTPIRDILTGELFRD